MPANTTFLPMKIPITHTPMPNNRQKAIHRLQIKNRLNHFVASDNLCTFTIAVRRGIVNAEICPLLHA